MFAECYSANAVKILKGQTMATRQEKAQETRQKLIDTAHEIIREKGLYRLGVTDITERAGVATGTFYTYFRNKEDIALEICKQLFCDTRAQLDAAQHEDITDTLALYCRCFVRKVVGYQLPVVREWMKCLVEKNVAGESMGLIKWDYDLAMLREILEEWVDGGKLSPGTPTEKIARAILCAIYGILTIWCMSDGGVDPEEMIREFTETRLKSFLREYLQPKA